MCMCGGGGWEWRKGVTHITAWAFKNLAFIAFAFIVSWLGSGLKSIVM